MTFVYIGIGIVVIIISIFILKVSVGILSYKTNPIGAGAILLEQKINLPKGYVPLNVLREICEMAYKTAKFQQSGTKEYLANIYIESLDTFALVIETLILHPDDPEWSAFRWALVGDILIKHGIINR